MNAVHRVLLTDSISPAGEEVLARRAEIIRAPDADPVTLRRLACDAEGIITRSKLPDDIIAVAPRLRGVMVANLPGGNAQSVAEYCVLAMLMLARNVLAITNALHSGPWDAARLRGAGAHEISGMTLGIVGAGEIGGRLARICRHGFGMRVLGNRRRLNCLPPEAEPSRLDDLLAASDFVVVTCPLTPETHHLFNRERLGLMKRTAWLINVGRGAVVQEEALVEALRGRRIGGAMLDVFEHYRLPPGHPLLALDNAVLTPHLAGMTVESRGRVSVAAAEEMLRMLDGEPPNNFVNPQALTRIYLKP